MGNNKVETKRKTKMKYTILGFQQEKLIENNLSTDDALVLRTILDMFASVSMEHKEFNGESYLWIDYTYFVSQIPIVGVRSNLMAKIKKLGDNGFIKRELMFSKTDKWGNFKKGKYAYIRPTIKLDELSDYYIKPFKEENVPCPKLRQGVKRKLIRPCLKLGQGLSRLRTRVVKIQDNKDTSGIDTSGVDNSGIKNNNMEEKIKEKKVVVLKDKKYLSEIKAVRKLVIEDISDKELNVWLNLAAGDIKKIKTVYEIAGKYKTTINNLCGFMRSGIKGNFKSNKKEVKGGFNDYEQRAYDYDELEKKLLGWDNND